MSQEPENSLPELLSRSERIGMRRRLNSWFRKHGRQLPWRETHDPYLIWISEIMLQQTTVKAVVPYFERFTDRFPTVQELAAASEEQVLQYWEGLGYYSRGRNLRKAAIVIRDEFGGVFPSDLLALQKLPGIGRYTAGAIRSFAFDLPAPIVEANTLRLYCRLLNYNGAPRSRDGEKLLWHFAEELQPTRNAGQVNQALMELGSQICTPDSPNCEACPLSMYCQSFSCGTQAEVPVKKVRPKVTQIVEATVAIEHQGKYLIRQREATERWAGMWDFVRFPVESIAFKQKPTKAKLAQLSNEVVQIIREQHHLDISNLKVSTEIRHSVTRYRIRLICFAAELSASGAGNLPVLKHGEWRSLRDLKELPMPITGRQFSKQLETNQ